MAGGFALRHTKRNACAATMVQALEKTYNKPAKINIKHEKAACKNLLREWCCLNGYAEYVLHHDYSPSTTVAGEKCVNADIEYVCKKGISFDPENSNELTSIVTNSKINLESSAFLIILGEDAYHNFY